VPNHNSLYRVTFSSRPDLKGTPRAVSGKGFSIAGTSWTIPQATWEDVVSRIAPKGLGKVFFAIQAEDALGRKTQSPVRSLVIQ